jgi:hypothetical protein
VITSRADFNFVVLAGVRGNLIVFKACRPARVAFAICCIEYERSLDLLTIVSGTRN